MSLAGDSQHGNSPEDTSKSDNASEMPAYDALDRRRHILVM
jgi:hypothetical protein